MEKIAVIKLGALGDVIRTLPLAKAIKNKFPNSELTWITKPESYDLIKTDKNIDKIFKTPYYSTEKFDVLYNFDIDAEATKLASELLAKEKKGFYSEAGYVSAFNTGAEYYLNTLYDDELKKSNKKTYQEMMFKAAELDYKKEDYQIALTREEIEFGNDFIKRNNLSGKKIIGIHMGASSRWPSKAWSEQRVKEFIIKAKEKGYEIILFGGPNELQKQTKLVGELKSGGIAVVHNDPKNSLREFASILNICAGVVCSDSLALHVAVGLGKKTAGLFFCTSPNEVESYDLLEKIVSPMLSDFFPEKMDQYSEDLVKSISAEEVLAALEA